MKSKNYKSALLSLCVLIVLNSCVQNKPEAKEADKISENKLKVAAEQSYATVNNWLDDFKNFRTSVYQKDVEKMKAYFNFPVVADTTQIWVAVNDNIDETKRPQNYPATFTGKDLGKYHDKLFNEAFVKTILKVKTQQLYQNGEYTTPSIKYGDQKICMIANYDKPTATLQLSVTYSGSTAEDGDDISESESATVYFFKVTDEKYLKFDKILFAG